MIFLTAAAAESANEKERLLLEIKVESLLSHVLDCQIELMEQFGQGRFIALLYWHISIEI